MEKVKLATILVYVFDVSELTVTEVANDLEKLHTAGMTTVVIANKIDTLKTNLTAFKNEMSIIENKHSVLYISATQIEKVEAVKDTLHKAVADGKVNLQSTIVSNTRHYDALQKANKSLDEVLHGMSIGITGDFLAQDIRHALIYLGEITGAIDVDRDILGTIFGKFCIGK